MRDKRHAMIWSSSLVALVGVIALAGIAPAQQQADDADRRSAQQMLMIFKAVHAWAHNHGSPPADLGTLVVEGELEADQLFSPKAGEAPDIPANLQGDDLARWLSNVSSYGYRPQAYDGPQDVVLYERPSERAISTGMRLTFGDGHTVTYQLRRP